MQTLNSASPCGGIRRMAPLPADRPAGSGAYLPSDIARRVRGLSPLARIEGVTLKVDTADHADESRLGDRDRLLQLTTSLVSLAVRYSRNGSVNLRVESSPDHPVQLVLSFADLSKFRPEERLLWSGRNVVGETLQSVIGDIVADLGAEVSIAAGLCEQTELSITLPHAPDRQRRQELVGLTLLWVGSAPGSDTAATDFLRAQGASLVTPDEPSALRPDHVDAVMVDVDDVDDAAAALFQVREMEYARGQRPARAIALLGEASREDIEQLYVRGFDAIISKPLCIEEIRQKLRQLSLAG